MLEALVFATVLCGFFGIIFKQNLVMKILADGHYEYRSDRLLYLGSFPYWFIYADRWQ
jgi:hypothetical protein